MIPKHKIYVETFIGGAAIYFAKEPSIVDVINDTNGELINFYEVLKRDAPALAQEISISLHSRRQHHHAEVIYKNPEMFDRIKRAWAIFMLANSSFGSMLDGSFNYDRCGKTGKKIKNKVDFFITEDYAKRLQNTQIECCDALRIIRSRDTADTFFYIDPPYVGADQGHYDGYTQDDFDNLLKLLADIKGKFLLSSYNNKNLKAFTKQQGWETVEISMYCAMRTSKKKVEVLTSNYPIKELFKAA